MQHQSLRFALVMPAAEIRLFPFFSLAGVERLQVANKMFGQHLAIRVAMLSDVPCGRLSIFGRSYLG